MPTLRVPCVPYVWSLKVDEGGGAAGLRSGLVRPGIPKRPLHQRGLQRLPLLQGARSAERFRRQARLLQGLVRRAASLQERR